VLTMDLRALLFTVDSQLVLTCLFVGFDSEFGELKEEKAEEIEEGERR
jgi:hypothetical protein